MTKIDYGEPQSEEELIRNNPTGELVSEGTPEEQAELINAVAGVLSLVMIAIVLIA